MKRWVLSIGFLLSVIVASLLLVTPYNMPADTTTFHAEILYDTESEEHDNTFEEQALAPLSNLSTPFIQHKRSPIHTHACTHKHIETLFKPPKV